MVETAEMVVMETPVHAEEGLEDWEEQPVAMEEMLEVMVKREVITSHP
jgi:hypothetical protein